MQVASHVSMPECNARRVTNCFSVCFDAGPSTSSARWIQRDDAHSCYSCSHDKAQGADGGMSLQSSWRLLATITALTATAAVALATTAAQ